MRVDMKVSDVLQQAGELIKRDGHCKGRFREGGKRCAVGAIVDVTNERQMCQAALREMEIQVNYPCLSIWNDAPKRKKAQVVRAFREAAERARSEGR